MPLARSPVGEDGVVVDAQARERVGDVLRAIKGAYEKAGVEGEVGRSRGNHLVPVPAVGSFEQLNALLPAG